MDFTKWTNGNSHQSHNLIQIFGEAAGEVLRYFEENELSARITRRRELQILWTFVFYDDGCMVCGSPFHHRPACKAELEPDCTRLARFLHLMNHPDKKQARANKAHRYFERRK